jgi:hypothetical protein
MTFLLIKNEQAIYTTRGLRDFRPSSIFAYPCKLRVRVRSLSDN